MIFIDMLHRVTENYAINVTRFRETKHQIPKPHVVQNHYSLVLNMWKFEKKIGQSSVVQ